LIAPALRKGLEINATGSQVSKSYIDMTLAVLKEYGIRVENRHYKKYIIKSGSRYRTGRHKIETDASGASYFFALAGLTGSTVRVKNLRPDSSQGDIKFADLLGKMGCRVKKNKKEGWIEVAGSKILKSITCNMENMPDTAQTLAVVAAFARGTTKITGLSTLKNKETDRLKAMKNELAKMGIKSEITSHSITIYGGRPCGAKIDTYNDHRMAMAFAAAGTRIPGMVIKEPAVVSKSFPEFWKMLKSLGVKIL
jgi:3-phosphoshikimate 1-carboxyvinyltransferase